MKNLPFVLVLALALSACSARKAHGDAATEDGFEPLGDGACGAIEREYAEAEGIHYPNDTPLTWATNPPSSGPHYPEWTRWGVYSGVVPRGHWVHNLEHGGVVVLYRCDEDCAAIRAGIGQLVQSLPPEPTCVGTGVARRIVVTEDPLLNVPVAAASWRWTYRARCLDLPSLRAFVLAHTGHASEDFCADGSYSPP